MNVQPLNMLVLYTRLPDYFLQCVKAWLKQSATGSKVWIVSNDPDKDAPYKDNTGDQNILLISRRQFRPDMVKEINPSIVYISGWSDPLYTKITQLLRKSIPVVMGLDNPWKGTFRQKIGCLVAPFLQQTFCTHIWAAGVPQYEFARRMGFPANRILNGLYCADTGKFANEGSELPERRILFVGRLVQYKRPDWLLKAFTELLEQLPEASCWQLSMVGNGEMKESLMKQYEGIPNIEWKNFTDPERLPELYKNASVFCLPSDHEHWGVVIHEAAAAGSALLISDSCGAASAFLISGYNGYAFRSAEFQDLRDKLQNLILADDEQLRKMGKASQELAETISHNKWVATLNSVLVETKINED